MGLLRPDGSVLPRAIWMKNFIFSARTRRWPASDRTRTKAHLRYTLLSHMLEIDDGDLILVPNMTENGREGLLLAKALKRGAGSDLDQGCYSWEEKSRSRVHPLGDDYRHTVSIVVSTIKTFPYAFGSLAARIRTQLGARQSCVISLKGKKNEAFVLDVFKLYSGDGSVSRKKRRKIRGHPPTKEQLVRGTRGENEFLRRLKSQKGFKLTGESLTLKFLEDRTGASCGFDFLCTDGTEEIAVEVKTFAESGGQIFMTDNELTTAQVSRKSYLLVGLIDSGKSPSTWKSVVLRDPYERLSKAGKIEEVRQLRVSPVAVWDL